MEIFNKYIYVFETNCQYNNNILIHHVLYNNMYQYITITLLIFVIGRLLVEEPFRNPKLLRKKLQTAKKKFAEYGIVMPPDLEKEIRKKIKEYERKANRSITKEEIIFISFTVIFTIVVIIIIYDNWN